MICGNAQLSFVQNMFPLQICFGFLEEFLHVSQSSAHNDKLNYSISLKLPSEILIKVNLEFLVS